MLTDEAATYASWFSTLSDPTRVRLLHHVASASAPVTVGELTTLLGVSQSTCSHHVRKLAEVGFLHVQREGTTTLVTVNPACCTGLPHAADAVMGALSSGTVRPVDGVTVRAMTAADWPEVRRIYGEGIASGNATFETEVPSRRVLESKWLPDHRWIAVLDGEIAGWAAATAVSARECYSGVAETSIYVADAAQGRGVGKTLLHHQVVAADADGFWTLQAVVFPENRASVALHHKAGFRTVGLREKIAQHHGEWRDTVLLERRRAD
ncbi:metalloregulator ArsR/SmtB family transcription factor [Lentzea sp. DG1S-22]|uniref:helix-turn-helix domain-containing GNAT family N-acetyltransferase n=1 Tax=Lentzea sp. DG1S-22 TaxID=3108822 RepID=UPI002E771AA1|nr:metalloregulator ArsR/SmtB family transcription factor [Lentzea sp. DG1S-22]WVH80072.1 metalloregulator ArsR/SmtB family transcription factor [Lentzea sp. DG1S-22]